MKMSTQTAQPADTIGRLDNPRRRPTQRNFTIDMLRGFAPFGILLVNMEFFNQSALNLVVNPNHHVACCH